LIFALNLLSRKLLAYYHKNKNWNWALSKENEELKREIELRKKAEEQLHFLAYHDPVTDLKNLRALKENTPPPERVGEERHIIQFTLDNIRELSALLDRNFINGLLREFAQVLLDNAPPQAGLFRGNGFSFYLVYREEPGENPAHPADHYCHVFHDPLTFGDREVPLRIKISQAPFKGAVNLEEVLKRTQLSLVNTKRYNRVVTYSSRMEKLISRKLSLDTSMSQTGFVNELFLLYQPIIRIEDKSLAGLESLVRWHNRELDETISPSEFIPLAEENGKIIDLGWFTLEENLKLLGTDRLPPGCFVTVNVSPIQFIESDFIEHLDRLMDEYHISKSRIKLEITESTVGGEDSFFWHTVEKLSEKGYLLVMDDFGTGESSINRLKKIRFDTIKIDQSFIKDIRESSQSRELFSSLLSLGNSLNNSVVVEGVEEEEEHWILRELGVRYGQGFLYSRPVPLSKLDLSLSGAKSLN
ncbi:MAG: bifunctional diguanylate cyclase/phosphodiesterase, partial [Spirochaetales bacterium]|nr:bifunctional diguanylate cyclase/phosphodiesterase [Spirochaetales bacterium]